MKTTDPTNQLTGKMPAIGAADLQDLVHNASDLIQSVDNHGRFLYVNAAWIASLGYSESEIKNMALWDIIHPDHVAHCQEVMQQVLSGGVVKNIETVFVAKDGTHLPLEGSSNCRRDEAGNVISTRGVFRDISWRNEMEKRIRDNEVFLETLIDAIQDGISVLDKDYRIIKVNSRMNDWFADHIPLNGKRCYTVYHGRSLPCEACPVRDAYASGRLEHRFVPLVQQGIETGMLEVFAYPMRDERGKISSMVEYVRDITEQVRTEEALRESEEKFKLFFDSAPGGITIRDAVTGELVDANPAAVSMSGCSDFDEMRHADQWLAPPFSREDALRWIHRTVQEGPQRFEWLNAHRDGSFYWQEVLLTNVHLHGVERVLASTMDITLKKQYEDQLKYLSLHDQLTGLFNRSYYENEISRLEVSRDYPITIIMADVDGLKLINDTMGHDRGDDLLRACAGVLRGSLRPSDVVARVGGDEFAVILPRTSNQHGEGIVKRIHGTIEAYNREGYDLPVNMSLGMATSEERSKSLAETSREADDAMYSSKLNKGGSAKSSIIRALVSTLGERDFMTQGHGVRLAEASLQLGNRLGITSTQKDNLMLLAQVHDLGKVGISDSILFKKGPLTEAEWRIMRQHPEKGFRIASSSPDLATMADLILRHHEWWDGTGYPLGISREEIPIECRILAVADAYDAMTNDRPYRKAMSREAALEEIRRQAGTQFDPAVSDAFLQIMSH